MFTPAFPDAQRVVVAATVFDGRPTPWGLGRAAGTAPEGPRYSLVISPGCVAVTSRNLARAERAVDVAHDARVAIAGLCGSDLLAETRIEHRVELSEGTRVAIRAGLLEEASGSAVLDRLEELIDIDRQTIAYRDAEHLPLRVIAEWSRKSRARMVRRLAELDYAPLLDQGTPAMITLTYPGDWRAVVPTSTECQRHVRMLRKRFARTYGRPMTGVWKREFQRRGAPHLHIWTVPPSVDLHGETFRDWLSRTWCEIVGATGEERRRHRLAGTAVDQVEGAKATDPRRLAVYFSKHGSFRAKDYQNRAPAEWVEARSVGRFWGYWGLDRTTAMVDLTPQEAQQVVRLLRRWHAAGRRQPEGRSVYVVEERERLDVSTGVLTTRRRIRRRDHVPRRMTRRLGYLVVNDGPTIAAWLASSLDTWQPLGTRQRPRLP